jgi:CelD/BcsL family acetyltransferase involved in cellulose biosynthesis
MDFEVLKTLPAIEAVAAEWRELHRRVGSTPYSNYDWVHIWWMDIGSDRSNQDLVVVIGRDAGRLAAVLPLVVVRKRGLRILQAPGFKCYHYCDTLSENAAQAADIWQAARRMVDYHVADIRDVYPDSSSYQALSTFAKPLDATDCFYLRVDWKSGKEWIDALSKKVRSNFRRRQNQLEEKGPVSFDVYKNGPELTAIINTMVDQKIALCKAQGKEGLFDYPRVSDYFRKLVESGAERENMLLMVLRCGEEHVAYALSFYCNDIMQVLIITYNSSWSKYSPGNVLMVRLMSWAIDNGFRGLNLQHENGDFKRQYVNEVLVCREFVFSGSFLGRIAEKSYLGFRKYYRRLKASPAPEAVDA